MLSKITMYWRTLPRAHRILLLATLAWTLAVLILAPYLHPIETLRGESDHYTLRAAQMREGVIDDDQFHPFLFIELNCLMSFLTGDVFVAGRTVSILFGALLLYASARMALALCGALGCFWTFTLLAANPHYVLLSMQAASDMTGASLFVLATWSTLFGRTQRLHTALTGLAWGLAISTRFNFVLLMPLAAYFVMRRHRQGVRDLVTRRATSWWMPLASGLALGYLPNLVPTLVASGTIYPAGNWKNLALKASGNWDTAHLHNPPYADASELLREKAGLLLQMGASDFCHYWSCAIGDQILGLPQSALAASIASIALALATAFALLQNRALEVRSMAALLVTGTASVAFTFHTDMRLTLFLIPLALICIAHGIRRLPQKLDTIASTAILIPLYFFGSNAYGIARDFYEGHPFEEIAIAKDLAARVGRLEAITSSLSTLNRHITNRTVQLHISGYETRSATAWLKSADEAAKKNASHLLVCGPKTSGFTIEQFLEALPSDYEVIAKNDNALALRIPNSNSAEWLRDLSAYRQGDGRVHFKIQTHPDHNLHAIGLLFVRESQPDTLVRLEPTGNDLFSASIQVTNDLQTTWTVVAHAIRADGTITHTMPITLTAE